MLLCASGWGVNGSLTTGLARLMNAGSFLNEKNKRRPTLKKGIKKSTRRRRCALLPKLKFFPHKMGFYGLRFNPAMMGRGVRKNDNQTP